MNKTHKSSIIFLQHIHNIICRKFLGPRVNFTVIGPRIDISTLIGQKSEENRGSHLVGILRISGGYPTDGFIIYGPFIFLIPQVFHK